MSIVVSGLWLDATGRPAGDARVDAREAVRGALVSARTDARGHAALRLAPGVWDVRVVVDRGTRTLTGEAWRAAVLASDAPALAVAVLRERARTPTPPPAPPPAPPVPGGARYVHVQDVAASVWPVAHGLGVAAPAVTVLDTLGREVVGAVTHHDPQSLSITFGVLVSGVASVSA